MFVFLLVLFLFQEIEADDIFHGSVCVGETELLLTISIGVGIDNEAGEILGVVPEQAGAEKDIGTDMAQNGLVFVVFGDVGLAITDRWEHRHSKDAIAAESPVVPITYADGIVLLAHFVEQQCGINVLCNIGRKLVLVEIHCHMIIREAQFPRTLTLALYSILSECSWP